MYQSVCNNNDIVCQNHYYSYHPVLSIHPEVCESGLKIMGGILVQNGPEWRLVDSQMHTEWLGRLDRYHSVGVACLIRSKKMMKEISNCHTEG